MGNIENTYIELDAYENEYEYPVHVRHDNNISFSVKFSEVEKIINVGNFRDGFYQKAITNLVKKSHFLQLYIRLIEDQVTEEEYESELDNNAHKYFVEMKELNSGNEFTGLILAMQNLPKEISIDEVSEIFGINVSSLVKQLNL